MPQNTTGQIDNIDTTTVGNQAQSNASSAPGNSVIVAADGRAEVSLNHQIQLTDSTQQNSKVINSANSVGSDLINSINIASASVQQQLTLSQQNSSSQQEFNRASIGLSHWESGYRYDKSTQEHVTNQSNYHFFEEIQRDYSQQITNRQMLYDVAIEKYDPRILMGEIKLSTPNPGPITLIPSHSNSGRISAGGIVNAVDIFDIIPNHVDWWAGWGATTLELPVLSAGIDAATVTHQNLTLNLSAAPPILNIGNIYFDTQAHYNDSSDGVVHWINTPPITFAPPAIILISSPTPSRVSD